MNAEPEVVVLCGGVGSEREVSLRSGHAVADALKKSFQVRLEELESEGIPEWLDRDRSIVFPALHGEFGEDGQLQGLLEDAGIHYCGSDARASRLCMDKAATKALAEELKIGAPKAIQFDGANAPLADAVIEQLGASLVVKPADQGSSVGLHFAETRSALGVALSGIRSGNWLIEQRIRGRELTVGLLEGRAMGVVEIVSQTGVYDYAAKYGSGTTEYLYPARLDLLIEGRVKAQAEEIFSACGCRDFARVDFLLEDDQLYFLEVNTLPGLTATSLLPKSASCEGLDFEQLAARLVRPAIRRFEKGGAS